MLSLEDVEEKFGERIPVTANHNPDEESFGDLVERVITPDVMFKQHFKKGYNIMLTGEGGTGKSTLINQIIEEHPGIDLTASTGVAALHIKGMTIHRWASLQIGPRPGESFADAYKRLIVTKFGSTTKGYWRVKNCKRLVIDEVSMIPGIMFDFFNYYCQRVRDNGEPFGGIQVVLTGDFCQLPPVRTNDKQPYDWCFTTEAFKNAGLKIVHLTKVHRQADPIFKGALSRMRLGEMSPADIKLLRDREKKFPSQKLVRLLTHNRDVDKWNRIMIDGVTGDEFTYEMEHHGSEHETAFLAKNVLAPETLILKEGVRVMLLVNNVELSKYFVNGAVGTVTKLSPDRVNVEIEFGGEVVDEVTVDKNKWSYDLKGKSSSYIKQLPMKAAYAISIHKAQGMTLESAFVDARAAREPGQAYVAFSRVRSLAGLNLKGMPKAIKFDTTAVAFYKGLEQHPSIEDQRKAASGS